MSKNQGNVYMRVINIEIDTLDADEVNFLDYRVDAAIREIKFKRARKLERLIDMCNTPVYRYRVDGQFVGEAER